MAPPTSRSRQAPSLRAPSRRRSALALVLCSAPWAFHGCAPPGETEAEAEAEAFAAMEAVYDRFTRAYRLGNPDSVVVLYTDDPLYLPGRGPVLQGREVLRSQFSFLDEIRSSGAVAHISFESVERGASGDIAWDVGYYTLEVERPGGVASPPSRGKFTTVWRRDSDGGWRIHVDGFSPAPPPPDTTANTR